VISVAIVAGITTFVAAVLATTGDAMRFIIQHYNVTDCHQDLETKCCSAGTLMLATSPFFSTLAARAL
jgi:uncharacterized membrane protein